jgi:hypothetical protein
MSLYYIHTFILLAISIIEVAESIETTINYGYGIHADLHS